MLIDDKQRPWATLFVVLALLATAIYFIDAPRHTAGPNGSTVVGLTFGILGFFLMLFCAFLGLKRRVPHWRLGRAQAWLRGHIWFGLLVSVLVAYHTGFRALGPIGWTLWGFLVFVTISGIVGLYIQQTVPRILLHGLKPLPSMNAESPAQQLKELMADCYKQAEAVVVKFAGSLDKPAPEMPPEAAAVPAQVGTPVASAAAGTPATPPATAAPKAAPAPTPPAAAPAAPVAAAPAAAPAGTGASATAVVAPPKPTAPPASPAAPPTPPKPAAPKIGPPMGGEPVRRFWLDTGAAFWGGEKGSPLANDSASASIFGALRTVTPAHIHPGIDDLEELAARRRQLDIQKRWMNVLHGWLIVHVPISWAFIVLVAVHAVIALRYWGLTTGAR
ncbi:MAG: hypothetical protein JNK35_08865 [Phycisphaerae bacterium]|nr:hypothetical protein [Phycisphaerae bacterium]